MGFNISVIKLIFVASTMNLLFNSIFNTNPIDSTSMRKAQHLFEGGVYLSKMGTLGRVPVLRTRRLKCLAVRPVNPLSTSTLPLTSKIIWC